MRTLKSPILIICFFLFLHGNKIRAQDTVLFDASSKPQLISKQFAFTEGPAVDKQGNIFFTDQPNNQIWEYAISGKLTLYMNKAGRPNGMYIDPKGNLVVCADEHNQLWQVKNGKKKKVLLSDYQGKLLNGPNDLWIHPNGDIYFTDPYYQRPWWTRTKPDQDGQKVYYLPKGKTKAIMLDDSLKQPNGIVGSPDGKVLYVADIGGNKTYKYSINRNGSLSRKSLFINKGADGITLDERGDLYLAGNGVTIFNPEGLQISHIDVPEPWTANICFGGKNKDVLFITASKAIYVMQMKVKGVE